MKTESSFSLDYYPSPNRVFRFSSYTLYSYLRAPIRPALRMGAATDGGGMKATASDLPDPRSVGREPSYGRLSGVERPAVRKAKAGLQIPRFARDDNFCVELRSSRVRTAAALQELGRVPYMVHSPNEDAKEQKAIGRQRVGL
jgi:hypothetical protein